MISLIAMPILYLTLGIAKTDREQCAGWAAFSNQRLWLGAGSAFLCSYCLLRSFLLAIILNGALINTPERI